MNHQLFTDAIREADRVRMELDLSIFEPINVFDACKGLGIDVRFIDVNMEGMYSSQDGGQHPTILLSNKRPFARRSFTCAHELGHHRFGHGTRVDMLTEEERANSVYNNEELLVDCFAGALLMPLAGLEAEFAQRGKAVNTCNPLDFMIIASIFGVGYQTLITHCRINNLISMDKQIALLKFSPAKILAQIIEKVEKPVHYKVLDECEVSTPIDLEASNLLILPVGYEMEGNHLERIEKVKDRSVFLAQKAGIVRVNNQSTGNGHFIRIQNENYIGLAEYRHLNSEGV